MNVEVNKMFDEKKYGALLMSTLPRVIENEQELLAMENVISQLLSKGENLSPEEEKLLVLVSNLVEDYEDEMYPMPDVSPNELLKHLMEENDLKQKDLLHIFSSSGIASEVVNGKREISKSQAKKLAE
ncbi:MAG: helix-turn-helix domain-containing protein [Aridibacter sp.]